MVESRRELVCKVFSEVLEQMAFMFADEASPEALPEAPEAPLLAEMNFSGAMSGTLRLLVSREMSSEVAANVLGMDVDEERNPSIERDALKELLNVTCGNILTAVAGDKPVFDLTIPAVSDKDAAFWEEMAARPEVAALVVDDRPVLLEIKFNEA